MKTIVLGPPGTGKTETLLGKVEDHLKETDPNKIGFFAFTQKAAYEARDRAMKKFDYTEDDLPYFRTLHSLAFRRLGIKKENVMQKRHYQDFGKKIAMHIAAMNPLSINEQDLDINIINKENTIIIEELKNSGKKAPIIDKIAKGKLNKFIAENTLLNQIWIIDSKKKVKEAIKESLDGEAIIKGFTRFKVGEGL